MSEVLYTPDRERVVATNAWAFLQWLRVVRGVDCTGWSALQQFSTREPEALRAAIAAFTRRTEAPLLRPLAEALLYADLRPDDVVLVEGPVFPWQAAQPAGTTILRAVPGDLLSQCGSSGATVLIAPAPVLAKLAFRRPGVRPDLSRLRTIVATGGPLSPEGRRRILTWVKPDLMLLARTGDTTWGSPMDPVLARPPATPSLFTPPLAVRPG